MDTTYSVKTVYSKKILIQLLIFIALPLTTVFAQNTIDIGVVAPMNTAYGDAMVSGIELYKDQINQDGGILGKKVVIWVKNDHNNKREAVLVAKKLAGNKNILMIIGHYFSSTSIAAGTIYKKLEIPAITASATSTQVTHHNDWYFSIVANNRYLANYLINYLHNHLHLKNILIIYTSDEYSNNIAEIIEPSLNDLNIELKGKFEIPPYYERDQDTFEKSVKHIVNEIKNLDNIGGVIISTHAPSAIKMITSLIAKKFKLFYPLITPMGRSLATFLTIPA